MRQHTEQWGRLVRGLVLALAAWLPQAAQADAGADEGAGQWLGRAHLFTNDYLGDGHDRWRSGSYQLSLLRGQAWHGQATGNPLELLEYRWRSAIISAGRVRRDSVDRPHVGELSFGLHGHGRIGAVEIALGADLVALGPQTGLARMQRAFHDRFGFDGPHGTDIAIADDLRLQGQVSLSRLMPVSHQVALRPFATTALGIEDRVTLGGDLFLGPLWQGALLLRDETTGHPMLAISGPQTGFTLTAGADWTVVGQSLYLPEGYEAEDTRLRARAGLHWQISPRASLFYGLSWHGREFEGQPEGQVLGALRIALTF